MSTQMQKNLMKKLISITGIAGAAVVLSFPAFAQINPNSGSNINQGSTTIMDPNNEDINQPGNVLDTDETSNPQQILDNNNRRNQPSSLSERDNINQRFTPGVQNQTNDLAQMDNNDGINRRLLTGGDSVRGVIFRCVNNPNPNCGR